MANFSEDHNFTDITLGSGFEMGNFSEDHNFTDIISGSGWQEMENVTCEMILEKGDGIFTTPTSSAAYLGLAFVQFCVVVIPSCLIAFEALKCTSEMPKHYFRVLISWIFLFCLAGPASYTFLMNISLLSGNSLFGSCVTKWTSMGYWIAHSTVETSLLWTLAFNAVVFTLSIKDPNREFRTRYLNIVVLLIFALAAVESCLWVTLTENYSVMRCEVRGSFCVALFQGPPARIQAFEYLRILIAIVPVLVTVPTSIAYYCYKVKQPEVHFDRDQVRTHVRVSVFLFGGTLLWTIPTTIVHMASYSGEQRSFMTFICSYIIQVNYFIYPVLIVLAYPDLRERFVKVFTCCCCCQGCNASTQSEDIELQEATRPSDMDPREYIFGLPARPRTPLEPLYLQLLPRQRLPTPTLPNPQFGLGMPPQNASPSSSDDTEPQDMPSPPESDVEQQDTPTSSSSSSASPPPQSYNRRARPTTLIPFGANLKNILHPGPRLWSPRPPSPHSKCYRNIIPVPKITFTPATPTDPSEEANTVTLYSPEVPFLELPFPPFEGVVPEDPEEEEEVEVPSQPTDPSEMQDTPNTDSSESSSSTLQDSDCQQAQHVKVKPVPSSASLIPQANDIQQVPFPHHEYQEVPITGEYQEDPITGEYQEDPITGEYQEVPITGEQDSEESTTSNDYDTPEGGPPELPIPLDRRSTTPPQSPLGIDSGAKDAYWHRRRVSAGFSQGRPALARQARRRASAPGKTQSLPPGDD